ncbi:MAG: cysteine synthase family protein [Nitrososphaerales archaeon]
MIYSNILELIGNTPVVRINNLRPKDSVEIYVKLEKFNPAGSIKDRIALYMIEAAEKEGVLTKDKIVIEPTSGNTGIGLALVCAVKGYKLALVMPETMSLERRKILLAYGARIILSPGAKGMDGAEDLARQIVSKNPEKYFMPNQFANTNNVRAHYETTAEEIWRDFGDRLTHIVAGMGTTGTLMGVSKKLKEKNPKLKIIGVEPHKNTPIQGLKNLEVQYVPRIWNPALIDEKIVVTLQEAEDTARLLTLKEGIFCGPSSGAIFYAALKKAEELDSGVILAILPDGGEKYLSTTLCDPERCLDCIRRFGVQSACVDQELEVLVKSQSLGL